MRRIGIIMGYIGMIVAFGGLLVGGIRFAQGQSDLVIQPPVVVASDQDEDAPDEVSRPQDSVAVSQPDPQLMPAPELPRTGVADSFLSVLGLGAITASVVAYVQSRRFSATPLT